MQLYVYNDPDRCCWTSTPINVPSNIPNVYVRNLRVTLQNTYFTDISRQLSLTNNVVFRLTSG